MLVVVVDWVVMGQTPVEEVEEVLVVLAALPLVLRKVLVGIQRFKTQRQVIHWVDVVPMVARPPIHSALNLAVEEVQHQKLVTMLLAQVPVYMEQVVVGVVAL